MFANTGKFTFWYEGERQGAPRVIRASTISSATSNMTWRLERQHVLAIVKTIAQRKTLRRPIAERFIENLVVCHRQELDTLQQAVGVVNGHYSAIPFADRVM
jgi:hypothetical protein